MSITRHFFTCWCIHHSALPPSAAAGAAHKRVMLSPFSKILPTDLRVFVFELTSSASSRTTLMNSSKPWRVSTIRQEANTTILPSMRRSVCSKSQICTLDFWHCVSTHCGGANLLQHAEDEVDGLHHHLLHLHCGHFCGSEIRMRVVGRKDKRRT